MACQVDWPLILEYVKVLASPVATLGAVYLVARVGVDTFRRQKTIERRLDWYEQIHRKLGQTAYMYVQAAHNMAAKGPDAQKRIDEATKSADELSALVSEAWLYSNQEGLDALHACVIGMNSMDFPALSDPTKAVAVANSIAELCTRTGSLLAKDIRSEMHMPLLTVSRKD